MLEDVVPALAAFVWGPPLVLLLVGGGLWLMAYSRLLPYRHFPHALAVLTGRYDQGSAPGDLSHFQALAAALSGTIGLGNIAGVAVAISVGGPGAVLWMWVTALVGVATKFFTCSLAVMYRGRDSLGQVQGGPMYVIREALGPRWRPLAVWFALAGLFGALPLFQANQVTQAVRELLVEPAGEHAGAGFDLLFGLALAALVAGVVFGGIRRIGEVAARLVPAMVVVYLAGVMVVLAHHAAALPAAVALIFTDALSGHAAAGGVLGAVILTGVQRGAFSNEAGIGTEAMAHGAARTTQPIREGLVAMLGPVIDTLIVCTATALAILVSGVWQDTAAGGVTLTAQAFAAAMPVVGPYLLTGVVAVFGVSTLFTYWYYGAKCLGYLAGAGRAHVFRYVYCALVVVGAMASLEVVIGVIDTAFALMAVPTMVSTVILAPRVMDEARRYFAALHPPR